MLVIIWYQIDEVAYGYHSPRGEGQIKVWKSVLTIAKQPATGATVHVPHSKPGHGRPPPAVPMGAAIHRGYVVPVSTMPVISRMGSVRLSLDGGVSFFLSFFSPTLRRGRT